MVDFRIISQLVEFILCILYDAVDLTVIPKCVEAIVFHLRTATPVYVSAEEQIQSEVGDSLCLVDSYRYNLNKVWEPSQALFVTSRENYFVR